MDLILQQIINGLVVGMGYSLIAVGVTLIFGILGVINFAHGEFYMIGVYGLYVFGTILGMNYFLAGFISIAIVGVLGYVSERFIVRRTVNDHINVVLATYALSLILIYSTQFIFSATPLPVNSPFTKSITFGGLFITVQNILILITCVVVFVALNLFINRTVTGRKLRAISQNSYAASVMGINIAKLNNLSFVVGACLAGLAGVLMGPVMSAFPGMGQLVVIKAFIIVILGGIGNVYGAIIGGILLGVIESVSTNYIGSQWTLMIGFVFLIFTLLWRPGGLLAVKGGRI